MTSLYFHILKYKYFETKTCHMLTAQPSTYDMFGLIELYGRKLYICVVNVDLWTKVYKICNFVLFKQEREADCRFIHPIPPIF